MINRSDLLSRSLSVFISKLEAEATELSSKRGRVGERTPLRSCNVIATIAISGSDLKAGQISFISPIWRRSKSDALSAQGFEIITTKLSQLCIRTTQRGAQFP